MFFLVLRLQVILDHFQWENDHNPRQQSWITIKNQPFPPKKLDLSVLSIWIGNRIIFFIFFASKKLLAPLKSRIGTCSVFCHSFSVSPGVWHMLKWGKNSLQMGNYSSKISNKHCQRVSKQHVAFHNKWQNISHYVFHHM